MKRISFAFFVGLLVVVLLNASVGADKLRFGASVRQHPILYLPPLAAEETGIWKKRGLDVQWFPFQHGTAQNHAIAAGEIKIGVHLTTSLLEAASKGLPLVAVSEYYLDNSYALYVKADSKIREPKDLKGAKLGVSGLGVVSHRFGLLIAKAHGVEKDVRFVATGGIAPTMAAFKVGHIDGTVFTPFQFIELVLKGEAREVARVKDYLPTPWSENIIYAVKSFMEQEPDTVRRVVKAILEANEYVTKNARWAIDKMKSESGYSEQAAKSLFEGLRFSRDGKMEIVAIENVRNFLIEGGLISREKTPPVNQLLTEQFIP